MRVLALAPALALLSLAACQNEPVETVADVEDQSGGEIVTTPVDPNAVPVNVPETPMTNVPADAAAAPAAEETPAQ
ncbi:hypothetical protein [Alteraurantiacibacter palmitatis]|uniref:Uncharacterized protein n=1 Tax=Alteraurantiacibacter palmitatis TaxID=2054628 RepID=A0ABV7EA03_9SPHN